MQQTKLGVCSRTDVACCVATRVIGHYPSRNTVSVRQEQSHTYNEVKFKFYRKWTQI